MSLSILDVPASEIVNDYWEPIDKRVDNCAEWIASLAFKRIVLGVEDPRKSECPGAHDLSHRLTTDLLVYFA